MKEHVAPTRDVKLQESATVLAALLNGVTVTGNWPEFPAAMVTFGVPEVPDATVKSGMFTFTKIVALEPK